jgi:hypothetical protein
MPYLELDLTGDFNALSNIGQNYLRTQIPGWEPRPGNIESILVEGVAQMLAEVVDQVSLVPPAVFAEMGQTIFGIPMRPAVAAVATATLGIKADAPAMTVPQQTQITVQTPSGEAAVFATTRDLPVPASSSNQALAVPVEAQVPGEDANGAQGDSDAGTANLVTAVDGVERVQVSPAQGGVEEEDQEAYLDRLADLLTIMAPRAITAHDFAVVGGQVPGVGRVLVLDNYVPASGDFVSSPPRAVGDSSSPEVKPAPQTGVPRATTLAITAEGGGLPDTALMQRVYEAMVAAREVNTLSFVISPAYTTIDVQATVVAFPGHDPATVAAAAEASVRQWLDPGQWGLDPQSREPTWSQNTAARLYEAVDWLNRATGVHYATTVQIRAGGGSWGTADVPLPGAAPLPMAGQILIAGQAP